MHTDTLDHRQRAIFVGLRRMTDDRNMIVDGFRHWSNNHANESLDVELIVSSLVSYLGLDSGQKKSLMISLHAASNKMTEDLPEVPKVLLERAVNGKATPASNDNIDVSSQEEVRKALPPHCVVTNIYIQSVAQLLDKRHGSAYDEFKSILRNETLENIAKETAGLIVDWAENGLSNLNIPESITEKDCKNLSHEIYLILSEVVGPNDADTIVNSAISLALKPDEASRFDPRQLL